MTQPLISVIIPLYNKEQWVKRSVASVLTQTYEDMEILIVNDGSTDNSLQVVKSINDPRIKIFDKSNGGVSSARNLGIKNAQGEHIAFLDADDEWEPEHLKMLLEGFEHFEDAIVICDDLVELSEGESKEEVGRRKLSFNTNESNEKKVHCFLIENYLQTLASDYFILSGSSVLIRASVVREHQLYFYENMTHGEDVNYWIQLSKYGQFVFCDYLGVLYHRTDSQSAMSKKVSRAKLTPDCFHLLPMNGFEEKDQKYILKFTQREYYKKAYQNRGLGWRKEELSSKIGDVDMGKLSVLIYLAIRYAPEFIYDTYRKVKMMRQKQLRGDM